MLTACPVLCLQIESDIPAATPPPPVISLGNYSSMCKSLRITALVLRFIHNLKCKVNSKADDPIYHKLFILPHEIQNAENMLILLDQKYYFSDILDYFSSKENSKKPTLVKQLDLFMCDGIIRSRGRIGCSDLPYDTKFPILLSNASDYSKLLINYLHQRSLHSGTNSVLALLREKFWIPKARQMIQFQIRKCKTC